MRDAADALNNYLSAPYGISLERALADATAGVANLALRGVVQIECDLIGQYVYDDDGLSEHFAGTFLCEGVSYCFTCAVFTDPSGQRYVEAIGDVEVIE